MKRHDPSLDPELEAFLEPRKIDRRAPADVRARALARARAIVAAGGAIRPSPWPDLPVAQPAPFGRRHGLVRVALAASIAITAGAVGAFAALRSRGADVPPTALSESPHPAQAVAGKRFGKPPSETPLLATQPAPTAKPARVARTGGDVDPFAAELDLLQRAHAAFTRRDFSSALTFIADHSRRFPSGRLAEQREALRVRSLAGSGRSEEAHRAAAGFAVRFPRSVLLPNVEKGGW